MRKAHLKRRSRRTQRHTCLKEVCSPVLRSVVVSYFIHFPELVVRIERPLAFPRAAGGPKPTPARAVVGGREHFAVALYHPVKLGVVWPWSIGEVFADEIREVRLRPLQTKTVMGSCAGRRGRSRGRCISTRLRPFCQFVTLGFQFSTSWLLRLAWPHRPGCAGCCCCGSCR